MLFIGKWDALGLECGSVVKLLPRRLQALGVHPQHHKNRINKNKTSLEPGTVAHAYNSSDLGDRGRSITSSVPAWEI